MNQPSDNRWWNRSWLLGLLLVAAVIFAYQPAWHAGFIWDDNDYVTNNPLLAAPDGLQRIWFSTDSPSQYFPLVYTTFRLEHALWGLNPAGYHWVNILLHAVNALLVWRLLWRLTVPGAWLAAAIFALHPVQVESVAWITELKNVQSLFFCLLTLLAWVEFVEEQPRWRWYGLALVFYALALFSKTTACTVPVALLLVLWLKGRPINRARLAQVIPFLLLGVAMGLVSMWWERNHQGTAGEVYAMSPLERVLVASRAVWFYAGKLVWPANLTFNYPLWTINPADPLAYGWLAAGAGLGGAIYFARRWVGRSAEVAAVFFVATLSPLLGFIMLYTFRYTFVTDHYQYAALIGPVALAAAGIATVLEKRLLPPVLCGVLVVVLGGLTWRQSRMYVDLETLWRTTIERNPDSYMGHNNLGAIYLEKGQVDEAKAHFQRALEILPNHTNALYNLGAACLQKGQTDEAIAHFQKVLKIAPGDAKAHSDLGLALLQKGRVDEALVHFQKALEIQPDYAEAHNNLGVGLFQKGQVDGALGHYRRALAIQPAFADAHYNLGTALLHQGLADEAIAHFQKTLETRPDSAKAHNNLGSALLQIGRADDAIAHFQTVVALQPDNAGACSNLGWALLQIGRMDEAIAHLQRAVEIQPGFADAHYKLAIGLFQKGGVEEAIVHFQKAVETLPDNAEIHNNLGWALVQIGRMDEAIAHFQTVLKIQPDFALAHNNIAFAFLQKGQVREAMAHYQTAMTLQPDNAGALSSLAWVLATWPEASIRNSAQAIDLARRANELSGDQDPVILRVLAAAYAEGGQFAEAVTTAERAIQLADSRSNPALGAALRSQIDFYRAGAPFHDPSHRDALAHPTARVSPSPL